MLWQVLGYWIRGNKYCVLDVPLLIEGPLWKMVGKVVVVYWYVVIFCIAHSRSGCSSIAPSNSNSSDSCSVITHQEKTLPPGSTPNYPSQRKSNTPTSSLTTLGRVRSWKRTSTRWCGGWSRMRGGRGGLVGFFRCSWSFLPLRLFFGGLFVGRSRILDGVRRTSCADNLELDALQ